MALTDADLEGFSLESERKPEKTGGVTVTQIPATLVKLLESEAPKALADQDYRLVLRVPVRVDTSQVPETNEKSTKAEKDAALKALDEATAAAKAKAVDTVKQLSLYASAWGKGQTNPRLYITKVPNGKDEKDEPVARLKVQDWDKVSKDNRPGRR